MYGMAKPSRPEAVVSFLLSGEEVADLAAFPKGVVER